MRMKLNKKGFMMAEVIVVSAIIIIFLGTVYVSYNKLLSTYKTRLTYYDTVTIYELENYRDVLIESNKLDGDNGAMNIAKNNGVADIYNSYNPESPNNMLSVENSTNTKERVVLIYNEDKKLTGDELNNSDNINPTFKDYLKYLSTSTTFETKYVMIMEKCNINSDNADDCKYSYLEIYDGSEITLPTPTPTPTPDNPSSGGGGSSTYAGGSCDISGSFDVYCAGTGYVRVDSCGAGTVYETRNYDCTSGGISYRKWCQATCTYKCGGVNKSKVFTDTIEEHHC